MEYIARPYQRKAVDDIIKYLSKNSKPALAVLPTGCHALGYELLDSEGNIIKVENVKVGDKLMSPDSSSRNVLKLHRGVEQMYLITLRNKLSFEINEGHLLQLYRTNKTPKNKGNYDKTYPPVVSITVGEYVKWSRSRKHLYKIKRAGDLGYSQNNNLSIHPYFLGLWLGDGTNRELSISTEDEPIKKYIYRHAKMFDLKITVNQSSSNTCPTYYLTKGRGRVNNPLRTMFIDLNLFNNKHIPQQYLTSNRNTRLRLLEGLIDTDGSLDRNKGRYEISLSNKRLANDVYILCCGLGLQPSINKRKTTHRDSLRISFRWCSDLVPELSRKRLDNYNFQSNGDMYSFKVEKTKVDNYYGFTLDGDHLYVDKHNIIHHNSGKSWIIADLIRQLGDPTTLVLQPSQELLKQNYVKYTGSAIKGEATLYSASVGQKVVGHVTYATPGSLKNDADKFKHVKFVIIDEAHLGTGTDGMMGKFIKGLGKDVKVIGLTATPIKLKNYSSLVGYYSQLNILTRMRPKFWNKIIHVTQVGELYEQGYLCPLRFTTYNFDMRNVKTKGSDFDMEEVSKVAQEYGVIEFTVKLIKEALKRGKKKILVFTPTVGDAYAIQEKIPELEVVSSKTKKNDRKRIVDDFVDGDLRIIANYGTLTTGFDAPNIDLIVCLRPTQSYAIWYQLIGRGIRIAPDKKLCDVVDLSGNYKVFGDPKDLVFEDYPGYGWGMFVKDHLLSGVPIGQKVHKTNLDISEKKITFGKYKGMAYKDIPTSYLEWIRDNFDLKTKWAKTNIVKPLKKLGIM